MDLLVEYLPFLLLIDQLLTINLHELTPPCSSSSSLMTTKMKPRRWSSMWCCYFQYPQLDYPTNLVKNTTNWYISLPQWFYCLQTITIDPFRCFVSKSPSFILKMYNLFWRNNLFTSDFDLYKLPNSSHRFFVVSSPHKFNNIYSARQSQIVLLYFLSSFSQSSFDVQVGVVPRSKIISCYQYTRRYSIFKFP